MADRRSAELFERALLVLPGGVSRNTILRAPHPLYARSGAGCRVIDVDGVERLDFSNNMASLIHGHSRSEITEAVTAQIQTGTAFTLATEAEVLLAEVLASRNPGFEQVRFTNSGTEAVMAALKAARAFTKRPKIAKVEGTYHGTYDFAEVSQTSTPNAWGPAADPARIPVSSGTPESVLDEVIVLPFNDEQSALEILSGHEADIACVLLDLMPHWAGLCPATRSFVDALRDWTMQAGALLVVDEVLSFRTSHAGMQDLYGVSADLTALGKIIGGGFPVGALAGRKMVMDVMNPHSDHYALPYSGTFSANPVTMTAGLHAMRLFDHDAVSKVNALAQLAKANLQPAIERGGYPVSITGQGSMFRFHMQPTAPMSYRESFGTSETRDTLLRFVDEMLARRVVMIYSGTAALSTAMGEPEIDSLVDAAVQTFKTLWG